ncbi:MAG TPA: type II toxin-antitoxin system HicB family antitoxin [Rhizomicrobium sp.]|nr:type II toxin-antitoxin system HicB family antitoxin [Rhizomicrobium sp.]
MAKRFYPAVLEKGAKGAFGAWFPDFPDCVVAGRSQEEAIEEAEIGLWRVVRTFAEGDKPLPEPTAFDKIVLPKGSRFVAFFAVGVEPPDPSERVNIYLPKSLIARTDKRAAELGMSRSSFFGLAVSAMIDQPLGMLRLKAGKSVVLTTEKTPSKPKRSER